MYNSIKIILITISLIAGLSSCNKWLDVKPEDKFIENQVFSSPASITTALNGVYLHLTKNSLYGRNLSMSFVEILAQRYNVNTSTHNFRTVSAYNYADAFTMNIIESIWQDGYVGILNINSMLENMDKYPGILQSSTENIYRGELHALRAMLHFDLLRLFGPVYSTADSIKPAIPYNAAVETSFGPLLPANEVVQHILEDLEMAHSYLANDPVLTNGPMASLQNDGSDNLRFRHFRMNAFAVGALQARVLLYAGNKSGALTQAEALIQATTPLFPWITSNRIISDRDNPNRVFSSELLFSLQALNLYDSYRALFLPDLQDGTILAPTTNRLNAVYENLEQDYRFTTMWQYPAASSKNYRTYFKYADIVNKDSVFRFAIPLIRKSELYLIAAECETDNAKAFEYLNTLRFNRGLPDVPLTANLNTEILKEYRKEFFGEGQLFFFYKRNRTTPIPNGATTGNTAMGVNQYVLPLPLSETTFRN